MMGVLWVTLNHSDINSRVTVKDSLLHNRSQLSRIAWNQRLRLSTATIAITSRLTTRHACYRLYLTRKPIANAKITARQPWYIRRNALNRPPLRIAQQYQRNLYIVEKYFQCATIPSLTIWVDLYSFSCCCLPNMPTSAKFRENLNVQQFKVIRGRWFWYQSKAHMRVPISD